MKNLVLVMVIILLFGCTTARKAERFYDKNPILLAKIAAEKFPVIPTYIAGTPIYLNDTIPGDSIPCPNPILDLADTYFMDLPSSKVKCPDSYRHTVRVTDTIYLENTAKVKVLELEKEILKSSLIRAETERDGLKKDVKQYRLICIVGFVMIGLVGFLLFRRKL